MIACSARNATGSILSSGTPDLVHIATSSLGPVAVIVSRRGLLGAIRRTGILRIPKPAYGPDCVPQSEKVDLTLARKLAAKPLYDRSVCVPIRWFYLV